ncbi:MAG TPA: R3H domain-containing nucleic acid-binding protein [Thermoanaerobaculia bacterium]|nr:R3H domain-containing nucleic acid-binding protein [Thermoanaerobaculia bacterium]
MSDKARRFFSADSLDRALLDAASHYGVAPEELRYEPIEKRGLAKRRKVVIRIDPDAPTEGAGEPEAKADKTEKSTNTRAAVESTHSAQSPSGAPPLAPLPSEPREERAEAGRDAEERPEAARRRRAPSPPQAAGEPAANERPFVSAQPAGEKMEIRLPASAAEWFELLPEADVEERVAAERWTTALLELAGLELRPRVRQGEDQLEIHLTGPDADWLAEDDGEILLSMQHLLPRLMQSDLERLVSCRVDCGGFQLLHEERLRARAHWAAEEVRSEGRAVTLEPMPPADRRIIHLALVHDATVDTESLGRGFFKRVSVRPS